VPSKVAYLGDSGRLLLPLLNLAFLDIELNWIPRT
jgi:hypothetical protein